MTKEIERKFKVLTQVWESSDVPSDIVQGYINLDAGRTVRVRIETIVGIGKKATVTIKGEPLDITRFEYEYEIPVVDAQEMFDNGICIAKLHKRRYAIKDMGHTWYIDEFLGNNSGLILAEIELTSPDENWASPTWIGEEVTHNPSYYNSRLAICPQCC